MKKYISKGMLVPDDVTIKIIEERFKDADVQNGIILDGFPRTVKQAEELDRILCEKGKKVDKVINLEMNNHYYKKLKYIYILFPLLRKQRKGQSTYKRNTRNYQALQQTWRGHFTAIQVVRCIQTY